MKKSLKTIVTLSILVITLILFYFQSFFPIYNKKTEEKFIYFSDIDSSTKYEYYRKGYIIVEIFKMVELDYVKLYNTFNKKVIFIILNYNKNQAFVSSAKNYNNPILITNLTYENILNAMCEVSIFSLPPECIG
jgi:hypothetical protein